MKAISSTAFLLIVTIACPCLADPTSDDDEVRATLAAGYRFLDKYGHGDLAAGFFTARSFSNASIFFVAEQGKHFGEVQAADIVAVDLLAKETVPADAGRPVSFGALQVASAVYQRYPEVNALLHSHPKRAMTLATLKDPELLMIGEPSFLFYERVAYLDADFFFDDHYSSAIARAFEEHFVLLIRNHAIMVSGKNVQQAFYRAYAFEQAADIQLSALAAVGGARSSLAVVGHEASLYHRRSCEEWIGGFDGSLEWPGLLRQLHSETEHLGRCGQLNSLADFKS